MFRNLRAAVQYSSKTNNSLFYCLFFSYHFHIIISCPSHQNRSPDSPKLIQKDGIMVFNISKNSIRIKVVYEVNTNYTIAAKEQHGGRWRLKWKYAISQHISANSIISFCWVHFETLPRYCHPFLIWLRNSHHWKQTLFNIVLAWLFTNPSSNHHNPGSIHMFAWQSCMYNLLVITCYIVARHWPKIQHNWHVVENIKYNLFKKLQ